jgi:deoxyribonuclease V
MELNSPLLEHELLKYPGSVEEAERLQTKWRLYLDEHQADIPKFDPEKVRYLAGLDVSYIMRGKNEIGFACAVLWDYLHCRCVETAVVEGIVEFPYVRNLLGFREARLMVTALLQLPHRPDVLLIDGNGILHIRRFGSATHIGLVMGIPSIGVAKTRIKGFVNDSNGFLFPQDNLSESLGVLGKMEQLNPKYKPVYISPGYGIELKIALEICRACTFHERIPAPIFLADQHSRQARLRKNRENMS